MKRIISMLLIALMIFTIIPTAYAEGGTETENTCVEHSWDDGVVTTPATCTEKGEKTYTCSTCAEKETEPVDALGHKWNTGDITTPANCVDKGVKTFTCSVCEETKTEEIAVNSSNHKTVVTDDAVPATCTKTGKAAGSHCSACSATIIEQKVTSVSVHTEVTDPAVAATCTKTGLTEGSHCSVCNATIKEQEVVAVAAHNPVTDAAVPETCTKTGLTEGKHCSRCGKTIIEQNVIPATGHTLETDAAVAATCTEAGKTAGSHCSTCNIVITTQTEVSATGHNWNSGVVTTPANCVDKGVKTFTCSVCKGTKTEEIAINASNHKTVVTDAAVAATCTAAGKTAGSHCSACDTVITTQTTVAATGHAWGSGSVTKAANCVEKGVKTFTCSKCKETRTEEIAINASNHKTVVTDTAVAATCTAAGKTAGSHCSACDTVITAQTTVAATGHAWGSGSVTKAANCVEKGVKTFTCSKCKETKTEEIAIDASNHKTVVTDAAVAATCTADGKTAGSHCSACKAVIKAQTTVAATGHNWGSGTVTKAATCTEKGVKTFTCSNCKKTKTEEIAIDTSNHKYSDESAKKATCTEDGYTAHKKCTLCGNTDGKETIAKTGHAYNVTWLWKTDRSSATATFTCSTCGYSKKATAYKDKGAITSKTTKEPTCTAAGQTTYTATVTYGGKKYTSTKTNTIAKLGHSYGSVQWTWKATVDSATAKYGKPCKRCDYVYGKTATVTASVTKKATSSATGTVKYTAKVTDGTTKTSTKSVTIPKISSGKLSYTSTTYNGNKKTPTLTVKDSSGNTISKDNYTVSGLTHTIPGTYKVTVEFKNRYSGTKTLTYTIKKHSAKAEGNKVTWTAMPEATKYEVYVDDVIKKTTTDTSYEVKNCGSHKVYVIALFKDGTKSTKARTTEVSVNVPHTWENGKKECIVCNTPDEYTDCIDIQMNPNKYKVGETFKSVVTITVTNGSGHTWTMSTTTPKNFDTSTPGEKYMIYNISGKEKKVTYTVTE